MNKCMTSYLAWNAFKKTNKQKQNHNQSDNQIPEAIKPRKAD